MSEDNTRQTQFDGESHRRLYEMIANAEPAILMVQGVALLQAAGEINKIAEDLKAHIDHVPWEGEGGEAFRRWTHHMAGESAKLATYTGTAGHWLNQSGQALHEAQLTPRPNYVETEDVATNGITDSILRTRDPNHEEAIRQLTKVASYYSVTQEYVTQQERPNFQPLDYFGSEEVREELYQVSTAPGNPGSDSEPSGTREEEKNSPHPPRDGGSSQATPIHENSNTDLNSTLLPASANPVNSQSLSPDGTTNAQAPQQLPTTGPTPPAIHQHQVNPGSPQASRPSTDRRVNRPVSPGQTPPARKDGIIGGTPQPKEPPATSPRQSRGVVMGAEHNQSTRGPMSAGIPPATTGSSPGATQRSARHLATEPGGHVHPSRQPGPTRDFTPGGTGLVQGAPSGRGSVSEPRSTTSERSTSDRPDYLKEDDQTWSSRQHRGIVPPVIE